MSPQQFNNKKKKTHKNLKKERIINYFSSENVFQPIKNSLLIHHVLFKKEWK